MCLKILMFKVVTVQVKSNTEMFVHVDTHCYVITGAPGQAGDHL